MFRTGLPWLPVLMQRKAFGPMKWTVVGCFEVDRGVAEQGADAIEKMHQEDTFTCVHTYKAIKDRLRTAICMLHWRSTEFRPWM